jgi:glycosyltransferase involved in cell wall biosynthesis
MINPEQPVFSDHPVASSRADSREPQPAGDLPPLVSVIVTVSPGEVRALGPTIRSLGLQSLRRWELIVAAVESTKSRGARRPLVRSSDPRVRLLPDGFPTAGAARSHAVASASAEAVAFLSSGDLLEPTALEKLFLAFACSDGRQLLTTFRVQFGADPGLHGDAHLHWEERIRRHEVPTYFWLMSRALHDEVAGFDPKLPDPEALWDFWRKAAAKGRLRALPEFLHWRKTRGRSPAAQERRRRAFGRIPAEKAAPTVEAAQAPPTTPLPSNPIVRSGRHLLVLHPFFIPGGAERVLMNELTDLLAKGWSATVIATDRTYQSWLHNFTRVTPDVFVAHHLLDPEGLLDKRPPDQYRDQWLRILNYFLDSRAPDLLLISNSTLGFASVPYLKITRPSLPVVTLRHSADWPAAPCDTDAMADLTIATSRSVVDGLVAKGRPLERIALHHSGIDLAKWRANSPPRAESRQALGVGPETPLILLVSRMSWEKGPDLALRVLERLAEQGSPFRAVWAGSGPLMDASRRFLEEKGLSDRVRLLGGVDDPTLRSLFAAADVFLLTSRQEGIPLSILDAFANGLPVVVSAVGGVPELLGADYEHLVKVDADEGRMVDSFCRHLQTLLLDAALRQRLGSRGLKLVEERFDRRHAGARFEGLLQQAMRANAEAPMIYDPEPVAHFAIAMAASESLSRSAWIETKSEAALLRGLLALTGANHDAPSRTEIETPAATQAKK